jgi:hypothetical protein
MVVAVGVGRLVVAVGAAARAVRALMLAAGELQAALTSSTVTSVATVAPCARRSTDRDHMSNRPFRRKPPPIAS